MIEVGAGGGSIVTIDDLGLLKVGPQSAGSDPGPACYGRGGEAPTVTDANVVLGYIDPEFFAGGTMPLYPGRAKAALEPLAAQLRVDVTSTAWGVHEVVSENMASAIRVYLAEKTRDPRRYALFAFGGGGPLHASHVAKKLHLSRVICPRDAGVLSAFGFLVAPPAFDFIRTYIAPLSGIEWTQLRQLYAEMEQRGRDVLLEAGVLPGEMRFVRSADMRYVGQFHDITVPVPSGRLGPECLPEMERLFRKSYEALYEGAGSEEPIEALNWRLLATGPDPEMRPRDDPNPVQGSSVKGTRRVYFPTEGYVETPVYNRYRLRPGYRADGPAVVEERESNVLVYPGDVFRVDGHGNVVLEFRGA
jgi:N-methylhydantoinase A/oxoprolinase/acetone carboxylase beta subunit